MKIAAVLALALALSGCAALKELVATEGPILKTPPAKCVTVVNAVKTVNQLCYDAAESIAQANVALAAVDRVTLSYVKDGTWNHAQAQPYYNQTAKLGSDLTNITSMYESNMFADALTKANALRSVVRLLRKEVAAQARK